MSNNAIWHSITVYIPKELLVHTKSGKLSLRPTLTKTMQVSNYNGQSSIKLVPSKSKEVELILGKNKLNDEYKWHSITIKIPKEMIIYTNTGKLSLRPTLTKTLKLAKWRNQTSIKLLDHRPGTFKNKKFEEVQIHDIHKSRNELNLKNLISDYVWDMNHDTYMYPTLSFVKSLQYDNINFFDNTLKNKYAKLKTKRDKGIFLRNVVYDVYKLYNPNSDEFFE